MVRRLLTDRRAVPVVLILQVVPLVLLPFTSYRLTSQEWWLPLFLTLLVATALFQVLVRRAPADWPWRLMGFSQGLNIISRLMMLMPHATITTNETQRVNTPYIVLTAVAMLISAVEVWYCGLPDVRTRLPVRSAAHPET